MCTSLDSPGPRVRLNVTLPVKAFCTQCAAVRMWLGVMSTPEHELPNATDATCPNRPSTSRLPPVIAERVEETPDSVVQPWRARTPRTTSTAPTHDASPAEPKQRRQRRWILRGGLAQVGTDAFRLAVMVGAGTTVLLATRRGLPISTTHALLGGLCGAGAIWSPSYCGWTDCKRSCCRC